MVVYHHQARIAVHGGSARLHAGRLFECWKMRPPPFLRWETFHKTCLLGQWRIHI